MHKQLSSILRVALLASWLSPFIYSMEIQAADAQNDKVFSSQSTGAEESTINEVRWYQIELLIYKQRPVSTEIAELWPKDIVLTYPDNWDSLKTPDQYQTLYQKKSVVNTPFILLDKKQFQFSSLERKLQLNRNNILFHGAWRQSLTQNLDPNADTKITPILIQGGDHFDDHYELEGSITLSLLRYLHVDTNLWLTHFVPITSVKSEAAVDSSSAKWPELPAFPLVMTRDNSTNTNSTTPVDATIPAAVVEKKYQVDEIALNRQSRRMRSYETHYIDHPKFGILIRMIPLDTNTMLPIPPKN